jgi:hypothetical protein
MDAPSRCSTLDLPFLLFFFVLILVPVLVLPILSSSTGARQQQE